MSHGGTLGGHGGAHGRGAIHGVDIAHAAKHYAGKVPYAWGGATTHGWDCSGFVNYILGHTFGLTLPGGYRWTGRGHGPAAMSYKIWGKAHTVHEAAPGDLCCWATHIGIALGPDRMVSAYDTELGTAITKIHGAGPRGEPLSIRRINLVDASMPPGKVSAATLQGCKGAALMLPILVAKGLITRAASAPARRRDRPD